MSAKMKRVLMLIGVAFFGLAIAPIFIGLLLFPRAELPESVTVDYCAQYEIRFDASSVEAIYLHLQDILTDPERFLQEDQAYRLFVQHRERVHDPFPHDAWIKDIERLTSTSDVKRRQQAPFRLHELILKNQNSFSREVVSNVLSYLPADVDIRVTIHLTALEGSAPAYSDGQEIAISLSHPVFAVAQMIHEPTGLSAFYNLGLHELFHVYLNDIYDWPTVEEHMENEIVIDMLIALQNEGMATHISHQLNPRYPSPFEWFFYVVDQEPVVRLYIKEMNELFAVAQTHPTGDAYEDIYRRLALLCYQRKGFYVVGAYMTQKIETELGRDALVQTISDGYYAFADTYNSIANENMKINFSTVP